jgi:hypothetical protein
VQAGILNASSLVSPETIGVSPFPGRIANISIRSFISLVPVLARASPGEYERRGGAPLEKILTSRGMGAMGKRRTASAARRCILNGFYSLQFGKGLRVELRNPVIRSRMDERR